jgi:hypothetical protein
MHDPSPGQVYDAPAGADEAMHPLDRAVMQHRLVEAAHTLEGKWPDHHVAAIDPIDESFVVASIDRIAFKRQAGGTNAKHPPFQSQPVRASETIDVRIAMRGAYERGQPSGGCDLVVIEERDQSAGCHCDASVPRGVHTPPLLADEAYPRRIRPGHGPEDELCRSIRGSVVDDNDLVTIVGVVLIEE